MSKYDTLNPMQREAVFHTDGPLLVLAGAGSGKTRVLTHRIAYLIEEKRVAPWNIMAITFTNKAAAEMRERVDKIVGEGAEAIWVSTFHSSCVRILRRFIDRLGYDTNFTIYDGDDQKTLMKQVLKKMQADPKQFKERAVLSRISAAKDIGNLRHRCDLCLFCHQGFHILIPVGTIRLTFQINELRACLSGYHLPRQDIAVVVINAD